MKEKIEKFVDDAIKNNDYALLDILWTFSYSMQTTGKTACCKKRHEFTKWLGIVCKRNLMKKYKMKSTQVNEKIKILDNFLNDLPDFLSYDSYDEDKISLRSVLLDRSSKMLAHNIVDNFHKLSELDKNVLAFVLNYIPIRVQDSINEVERKKEELPNYEDKYANLLDFSIRTDRETDDIVYFNIKPKEWTYIFNQLFDEELKEQTFKIKTRKGYAMFLSLPSKQYDEYSFWQFGDELVRIGIGYWTFWLSSKGNCHIDMIISDFLYETVKTYKEQLPMIENFVERLDKNKTENETQRLEKKWGLEETDAVSDVLESEIETSLISNPDVIEEGLELIENQYSTSVGFIDILCKEKNGNFVVIELKRGKSSDKVVAQIQRYMAWVIENLAGNQPVRGIIVVKEYDEKLEYALKGSKFPIAIKTFGREPPIEENIKYCDGCRKRNRKSAKYCITCGQEFWM